MTHQPRPAWAARIQAEREARDWSKREMARRLLRAEGLSHQSVEHLARQIFDWERGKHFPRDWATAYTTAFGISEDELFGPATDRQLDAPTGLLVHEDVELIEIARRAENSDLGAGALEMIDVAVDRLCRDYPTASPAELRTRGRMHLEYVLRLVDGRTTLSEHRELLVRAGWLAALLACAYYDFGDKAAAEIARRTTRRLGEQAGHGELIGWSWEIAAWFALVERRYTDVVTYSEAGLRHAGASNAAVQLTLQAGRGYARLKDRRAAEALKAGRKILDQLPRPDHPENHFVFDHDKYEFYCSTIYTMLGQNDAAEEHAREVVTQCQREGSVRWPMRLAMVNLDLALVAGRRRDLEGALVHGRAALEPTRRSGDLLPRAVELCGKLDEQYPQEPLVTAFAEQLRSELRALPSRRVSG